MIAQDAWREYLCKACGYIYHERDGDIDSGLAPGTRFEDIPEDWYCPICGVTKADFVLMDSRHTTRSNTQPPVVSASKTISHSRRFDARKFDVVIVGGGTAAWTVAETLREESDEISIAIVSQCDADRYDKPLLSVAIARNLSLKELVKEPGATAAQRLNVSLFPKVTAISLRSAAHVVRTTLGDFHYKNLVIAQGAQSVLPSLLKPEYCWRINHLSQYVQFRKALGTTSRRVLVIGAGLIGSELSNDLALGGHSVTLVDVLERPLARLLTQADQADALLKAWKDLPLKFYGCTEVLEIKKSLVSNYEVRLSQERNLTVDMIVVAAGLRTCDRLVMSAGLAWNNGIVVERETLMTSGPDIYALGDCISVDGETSRFIEPIRRQARTIASQIVGDMFIPYEKQRIPVRVKTSSLPMTVGFFDDEDVSSRLSHGLSNRGKASSRIHDVLGNMEKYINKC